MSDNLVFLDFGSFSVYWFGVFMMLAVLMTALVFIWLRRIQGAELSSSISVVLMCMPAALVMARIFYCWFGKAFFADKGLFDYIDLTSGGYALYGALAGIFGVLAIYSKAAGQPLADLLDAAVPGLSLSIAIGRFAGFLSGDDIGFEIHSESLVGMPFVLRSESENAWILWVGFFEGIIAAIMFVFTFVLFLMKYKFRIKGLNVGDTTLSFMLIYGLSQTMLESMRNDSLFMITLGFVRISQIISIVMAVGAIVIVSVQSCRIFRLRAIHVVIWVLMAAALTAATVCEFKMSANTLTVNYIIMGLSLRFMLISSLFIMLCNTFRRSRTEKID